MKPGSLTTPQPALEIRQKWPGACLLQSSVKRSHPHLSKHRILGKPVMFMKSSTPHTRDNPPSVALQPASSSQQRLPTTAAVQPIPEVHTAQGRLKAGLQLLLSSLNSGNAALCRAALHQMQDALHNSNVSDNESYPASEAVTHMAGIHKDSFATHWQSRCKHQTMQLGSTVHIMS